MTRRHPLRSMEWLRRSSAGGRVRAGLFLLLTLGSILACQGALMQQVQLRAAWFGTDVVAGKEHVHKRQIVSRAIGPHKRTTLLPYDAPDDDDETDSGSDTVAAIYLETHVPPRLDIVIIALESERDLAIPSAPPKPVVLDRETSHAPRGPPCFVA